MSMKKINVPGSKSISNSVLLLAALSDKPIVLENLLESDDTVYMRQSLEKFGVKFENLQNGAIKVIPNGFKIGSGAELFIGNAGTAARFLSCVSMLLEEGEDFYLDGIPRMQERPQADLFNALPQVGVNVDCEKNEGFLPAKFTQKSPLAPLYQGENKVKISGRVSSQFISGLLLVAPRMKDGLTIEVIDEIPSMPYIKMTLEILKIWGVKVEVNEANTVFKVHSGIMAPERYLVPSDMSSASYPVLYSLLMKEEVVIENFGEVTLQGDEGFLQVAEIAGAEIRREGDKCFIKPSKVLKPIGNFNWSAMPDVSMTGMVLAACADGESYFTGLESLRVKECDRIAAMEQLRSFGAKIEVDGDDVKIIGNPNIAEVVLDDIEFDSFDDHRIAMCFGILRMYLGLGIDAHNKSWFKISDPHCVAKTWPNFWLDFADVNGNLRAVAAVILKKEDKYLIVKKPRKDNAWQFPQGGVDEGEMLKRAGMREVHEECGDDLAFKMESDDEVGVIKYFFPADFKRHDEVVEGAKVEFLVADYIGGEVEVDNDEIIDYKWVGRDELGDYFEGEYLEKVLKFL